MAYVKRAPIYYDVGGYLVVRELASSVQANSVKAKI